jgi:hypothetical protein
VKRLPLLVVLLLLAVAVAAPIAGGLLGDPSSSPSATPPSALGPSPSAGASATTTGAPTAGSSPALTAPPSPTGIPVADVAIVPVTHFRSPVGSSTFEEVASVLAGTNGRYEALELVESEADAILAALRAERPSDPSRLVLAPDVETLSADLAANRKRLAFIRADAVWQGVKALSWGRHALFGVSRVATLAEWTLFARLPAAAPARAPYDPAQAWTMFAGGDILLDRGVYKTVKVDGKGVDFPFDGGTAEITGRVCCSQFGHETPLMRRTGNEGALRGVIAGADVAIANFENPAPDRFRWHTTGTVFSGDPTMIEGLSNAGLDWVSLANNHIGDAGRGGLLQTIDNLESYGIASSGAGANRAEAHTPAMLDAGGQTVAFLGYDTVASYYFASAEGAGSARMTAETCRQDIAAARDAGADVVVVFPHWGTEYDATPFAGQQALARRCIEAGADMIIGNHAHWAGAMEIHEGKPIWYALGNFVFDQVWSEPTMEGITLELTFVGTELRQIRMRPHIILDRAQPNFLDPTGDGRVVMGQVFDNSGELLPW